jgi:DnaJ-class molecular chaperone
MKRITKERTDTRECSYCNGTGKERREYPGLGFRFDKIVELTKCIYCNGKGIITRKERILIKDYTMEDKK